MSSLSSTTTTTTSRNARQAQPMSLHFQPSNSLYPQQSRPSLPRRISARDRRFDEKDSLPVEQVEKRTHNRTETPPKLNVPIPVSFGRPSFTSSPTFWLILYFFFNLSLTLYNKSVLVRFPYPYTLTALHALCSTIGSYVAQCRGYFTPASITPRQNMLLMAFSVLYTINIAVSNISLQMVTIPFHQVVRSTTPFFTLLLSVFLLRSKFSSNKMVSLMPVVGGVALATFGDYSFTAAGLLMTLLGTVLAALKTISTNRLQSSPSPPPMTLHSKVPIPHASNLSSFQLTTKLHPLDLLLRMSPLAFIQCVVYAHLSGELDRVRQFSASHMSTPRLIALVVNGMIAFGLNVVSFTANKKTSALTMTVAANVKQVLTILLAVMIFNLRLTAFNASGILLTLIGGGWYGLIEYREKQSRTLHPLSHNTPTNGWAHPEMDYPSAGANDGGGWLKQLRFGGVALSNRISALQGSFGLSPGGVMKEKMTGPNSPTPESGWPH